MGSARADGPPGLSGRDRIPGFPIHPSILSHRAGAPASHERRMQSEKVAEIFVRKFREKIAARHKRRRTRNHIVLTHPDKSMLCVSIPNHEEVDRRLLRSELRKAGLTVEEFRGAWERL